MTTNHARRARVHKLIDRAILLIFLALVVALGLLFAGVRMALAAPRCLPTLEAMDALLLERYGEESVWHGASNQGPIARLYIAPRGRDGASQGTWSWVLQGPSMTCLADAGRLPLKERVKPVGDPS